MTAKAITTRLGLQTIIYGERFPLGLERTLKEIKDMGFTGVEFFQAPHELGNPEEFERLMDEFGLTLLGLAGGSLDDRRAFCARLRQKPKYIYIQDLELKTVDAALACGCQIAVHPIQYSKLDSYASAVEILKELKSLRPDLPAGWISILPDSGHLYLGNENFAEILDRDSKSICFIHLKDWTPQFGTSMFSYARGFCELGRGIVMSEKLREIVYAWHDANDENWIIVEQDSDSRSPRTSCTISLNWLNASSSDTVHLRRPESDGFNYGSREPIKVLKEKATDAYVTRLLETLNDANLDSGRDVGQHYLTILKGFSELVDLKCANIWEISPREQTAILRSFWHPLTAAKHETAIGKLRLDKALCGLAVAKQRSVWFPDVRADREDKRSFSDRDFIERVGIQSMVSIPIPNHWNPNQPEIIINLFPQTLAEIVRDDNFTHRFRAALDILKPFFGITIERAWEQKRAEIHDELNWIAAENLTVEKLLNSALEPIRKHMQCDAVKIFLLNEAQTHLRQLAPRLTDPSLIAKGQGDVGRVWHERTGYNTGTMVGQLQSLQQQLLTPIYRQGRPLREVMGVIWCQGKRKSPWTDDFTVTDELTLDAAQAALVPQLERMLAAESRAKTMARVNHELKGPLTIFLGATEAAIEEMDKNDWHYKRDHLGTMRSYLRVMSQVVAKATFLKQEVALKLERSRILLFSDVIKPAIDDLEVYLGRRRFSAEVITTPDPTNNKDQQLPEGAMQAFNVKQLPPLYVDRSRFQQVVFNILYNAIKYAKPPPVPFEVEIIAATAPGGSDVIFRDWGTGIPVGMNEAIFLEGVRGPDALKSDIIGDGLGLFIVREILAAHGATIKVTNRAEPTEFTIFLPKDLSDFSKIMTNASEKTKKAT